MWAVVTFVLSAWAGLRAEKEEDRSSRRISLRGEFLCIRNQLVVCSFMSLYETILRITVVCLAAEQWYCLLTDGAEPQSQVG